MTGKPKEQLMKRANHSAAAYWALVAEKQSPRAVADAEVGSTTGAGITAR